MDGAPLTVASFNLRNARALDGRHWWPLRRRATALAVAGLEADVVALQEVSRWQLRWLRRHLSGTVGLGRPRGRLGGEQVPLLVRSSTRLQVLGHRTRWFGATPDRPGTRLAGARRPRIATIARLAVDGVEVEVASTHLDERSAALRQASLEQLVGWLDPAVPRILLGDLNADPGAPALTPLVGAGLRSALPMDAGGTEHGFTGRTDGRQIDHVFVSEGIAVLAAEVRHPRPGGRLPSDHWPVVADLRVR